MLAISAPIALRSHLLRRLPWRAPYVPQGKLATWTSLAPGNGRGAHRSVVEPRLACAQPGPSKQCLLLECHSCGHATGIPAASCHLCEGKGLMRRHLRRRLWLVPLSASALALTTTVAPITSSSADTITTTACNARTNN